MPRRPPKLNLTPGRKDGYGNAFAAIAVCSCGHEAQLPQEWVKLAAMYGKELEQAKARLRCSKCDARQPRVEVYRVSDA